MLTPIKRVLVACGKHLLGTAMLPVSTCWIYSSKWASGCGAAMTAEALPMIERLGLQQDDVFASPAPALSWSGEQFGLQIHLVQNG